MVYSATLDIEPSGFEIDGGGLINIKGVGIGVGT